MNDPQSRFQPVETASLLPARSWITRSEEGPFIDTGVEIQFREYGRLYISYAELREMADQAGLLEPVAGALEDSYNAGMEAGRALAQKEIADVDVLAHRLIGLANGLRPDLVAAASAIVEVPDARAEGAAPSGAEPDRGDLPRVFVTDGDDHELDLERAAAPRGQGDGTGRLVGPALVPGSAGDGGSLIV